MGEENGKSWWHSLGGTLTGIAALVTAITGLILALRGTNVIGPEHSVPDASRIDSPAVSAKHGDAQTSQPTVRSARAQPAPAADASVGSAPLSTLEAVSRAVRLPEKREYELGTIYDKARYTLLSAELTRHTAETNQLAIRVRITAEGPYPAALGSSQFTVDIDDRSIPPKVFFTDRIPSDESRERELHFTIPATTKRTLFRIRVSPDHSAEIPLTLQW
jgi:hypothetical protein